MRVSSCVTWRRRDNLAGEEMPICDRAITRGLRGGALIALWAGILPLDATAQPASPTDRIDAIERQIRNLQSDLQHLKNELGEAKQQLRQSRSEAQRAKEEALQAQQAAERARQDAVRAATAETHAQAATQAEAAANPPPAAAAGSEGVKVSMPEGRPTIATADG